MSLLIFLDLGSIDFIAIASLRRLLRRTLKTLLGTLVNNGSLHVTQPLSDRRHTENPYLTASVSPGACLSYSV